MAVMDDIADDLAIKALDLELKTGNEALIKRIADALASSSPTMEETFLTAVRIRRAERRARALIATLTKEAEAAPAAEPAHDPEKPSQPEAITNSPSVSFDTD